MRFLLLSGLGILIAGMAGCVSGRPLTAAPPREQHIEAELSLWPQKARHLIATSVAAAAQGMDSPFATFDADGTLWSSDATESFLAYLDAEGILTPGRLDAAVKPLPVLPNEGIYSYYQRLCAKDKAIGYPWCAQAFAGFTLAELRRHYAAMMKTRGSRVTIWTAADGQTPVAKTEFVTVPRLFPQQVQLIRALEQNGIRVFIVTASPEELVRFLACSPAVDPSFDLNLPPERVIGVNVLLRDDVTGEATSSRLRLHRNTTLFDAANPRERWESQRLTSFVLPPVTMYTGKVAAITAFIHPTRPPVLAAGDSGSDFPMLFYSAGIRLWIDHPYTAPGIVEKAMATYQELPDPRRGWVRGTWDVKNQP